MRKFSLTDFSGGIAERPLGAGPDTVQAAKGFILDGSQHIRTQWDTLMFNSSLSLQSIIGYETPTTCYVLGLTEDTGSGSSLHYFVVGYRDNSAFSTTPTLLTAVTANHSFSGPVPRDGATFTRKSSTDGVVTDATTLTLHASDGILINSPDPNDDAYVVYETAPGTLAFDTMTDRYPELVAHPDIPNQYVPKSGVMPPGTLSLQWGNRLIVIDTHWFATDSEDDTATDSETGVVTQTQDAMAGNTRRYPNAYYVSEPGDPFQFDTLALDVPVANDCQIVDVCLTDLGLVLFTTSPSGEDGLVLLAGSANEWTLERISTDSAPVPTSERFRNGDYWAEARAFVYIASDGYVRMTDGRSLARLDGPANIELPEPVDGDHVQTIGSFMFVRHSGRLLVMRSFGDSGGWTELQPFDRKDGGPADIGEMASSDGDLFYLQDGNLVRVLVSGNGYGTFQIDPTHPTLTEPEGFVLASSTVSLSPDNPGFETALLHRVGMSCRSDGSVGYIISAANFDGPWSPGPWSSGVPYETVFSPAEVVIGDARDEIVWDGGVGFVSDTTTTVKVSGDVVIETLTFWVSAGASRVR